MMSYYANERIFSVPQGIAYNRHAREHNSMYASWRCYHLEIFHRIILKYELLLCISYNLQFLLYQYLPWIHYLA